MKKHPVLAAFLLACAAFAWIHAVPGFGDPDAYYHLRITRLTAEYGPVRDFPWLPFTTLAQWYADHHFLYHLALIPFLEAFGDFYGLKIATVLSAASAVAAFAALLRAYGVRRPFLWTLPLFAAPGFLFRMALTKTTSLSFAALCIFLILLKRGRPLPLFLAAFAFVWLYGGWPILAVAAVLFVVVSSIDGKMHGRQFSRQAIRTLSAVYAGLSAGLAFNPFFPENFFFYWEQIVQIAVLGRSDPAILVGGEWYPTELGALFMENIPLVLIALAPFALLARDVLRGARPPQIARERLRDIAFAIALATPFLLMTLRQVRHKEYALPLLLFVGALLGDALLTDERLAAFRALVRSRFGRFFAPAAVATTALAALLIVAGVHGVHRLYATRVPFSRFAAAGEWLRAHVPVGVVFHSSSDDFAFLFYRDTAHRWIAGLDPLFFYRADPELYWLWRDIGDGRRREDLAGLIRGRFGARYVFVRAKRDALLPVIKNDPSFERVYADGEAEIWRISEDGR